jgi:sugar/nucleoside kinase (ribokinase family)
VRPLGATVKRSLDARTAFDNLQWDFDLADVAQEADAVVFGALAQRSSQTWFTIQRFLSECRAALRLMNLLNRGEDDLNRSAVLTALDLSDAALLDRPALRAIVPTAHDQTDREVALPLLREANLVFLVLLDGEGRPTVHTPDAEVNGGQAIRLTADGALEAGIVGFLHGILAGWEFAQSLELAGRLARHTADKGQEPIPEQWLTR